MSERKLRWGRLALGLGLGAAAGFAYATFIGCGSGHCAITSNPLLATLYGGVMGVLVSGL